MVQRCNEIIGTRCNNWNHEGQWLLDSKDPFTKLLKPGKMCPVTYHMDANTFHNISLEDHLNTVAESYYRQWHIYWDMKQMILVEKSPQSLVKITFLYKLFGKHFNVKFLVVIKVSKWVYRCRHHAKLMMHVHAASSDVESREYEEL